MADSTVLSPIQFLAGLRRISKRYLQAKEGFQPIYEAWDDVNVARMEAEAAEEVDQALIDKLTAEESRLESEMMRFHELEDLIDSLSRELTHILGWPDEKIADAIRRFGTVNGLRALHRIDGSKLEDLQDFPGLLRALSELAWRELPLLPAWATKDTAAIETKHHVGGPIEPKPVIAEQAPSQPLANENAGAAKQGRCLAARWPAILEHLRELMDNGRPCPTYAAIQEKFKCTSTPVGRAFKEGRNEPAFERWCELGAAVQPELEILEDPELLETFNEYAGTKKLSSDVRAESWQNLTKASKKQQRELVDCMKKELSQPDE